jgi:chromosome segregation ATPase
MTDEWAEGAPYWKAPNSKPSDTERSTWGEGSWDAELRDRERDRAETYDIGDSVELLISLTAGKAEKSARHIVGKYEQAARDALYFKQRLVIADSARRAAYEEMLRHRQDLAKLRDELERCEAHAAGVQADNDTLRRDIARLRDERDEARNALQCFERIVLNGGNNGQQPKQG